MTDVGSARVEVEGDVRNFARQTERDLNRALAHVKPDEVDIKADPSDALKDIDVVEGRLLDLSEGGATVSVGADTLKARAETERLKDSIDGSEADIEVGVRTDKNRIRKTFAESGKSASKAFSSVLASSLEALPFLLKPTLYVVGGAIAGVFAAGIGAVLGPLLGGVISGAILAGGAASLIGLGAFLLKGEKTLKTAAKSMADSTKKVFTRAAQPMLKPLVRALGMFQQLVVQIGPQIRQMFASIAPAIVPIAHGLSEMVKAALPGLTRFMAEAGSVLKSLVDSLPDLGKGFSDFFDGIASGGEGTKLALNDFFRGLGAALAGIGEGLGWLASKYEEVRGPLIEGFSKIGDGFKSFWASVSDGGPSAMQSFKDFGAIVGAMVAGLGAAFGFLLRIYPTVRDGLITAFNAIKTTIEGVVGFVQSNNNWLGPLTTGVLAIAAAIKIWTTAVAVWTAVTKVAAAIQLAFNAILLANPIGLIILAIVGLVAALTYFFTQTEVGKKIWAATWGAIKVAAAAVADWFTGTVVPALTTAWDAIKAAAAAVADWFTGTFVPTMVAVWGYIKAPVVAVANWFTGTLVPALTAAWDGIKAAAETVANWYQANLAPLFQAIGELIVAVFDRVKQAAGIMLTPVTVVFMALWAVIKFVVGAIVAVWSTAWSVIKTAWEVFGPPIFAAIQVYLTVLKAVWGAVWTTLSTVVTIVFGVIKAYVTTALSVLSVAFSTSLAVISSIWRTVWNNIKTVVSTVWSVVKTIVSTGLAVITGIIRTVTALIKGDWRGAWNAIKATVSTALNGIRSVIGSMMSGARAVISSTLSGIKSTWTAAWNGLKGIVSNAVGGVRSAVNSVKSAVIGVFSGAGSWLASAGRRIIDGLISGLRAGFARVRSTLGALTSLLPSWKGPASVDRKILEDSGRMVMQGFERGMHSEIGSIRKALGGLTADLPSFAARGGDGASAASPGGQVSVTIQSGAIVIQGQGRDAGAAAAEAVLERLAAAATVR